MNKDYYKKGLVLLSVALIVIISVVGYYISKKAETNEVLSKDENSLDKKDEVTGEDSLNFDGYNSGTCLNDSDNSEGSEKKDTIKIDISGCVKNPGIYELDIDARVDDAISKAGGLTEDANEEYISKYINKAKKLSDEDKIYIPSINDDIDDITDLLEDVVSSEIEGKININTASKEELMTLDGIGESYADKIIEYRKKQKFMCIEDLMNVSGIGQKKFDNIKDNIKI